MMPIAASQDSQLRGMEGVHLFHFGLSSCSQRVRLALEEKGVAWESHIVDLHKAELNNALATNRYVAGDEYSLADIATVVNVHRYRLLNLNMDSYSAIEQWYRKIESRLSFHDAIAEYEHS